MNKKQVTDEVVDVKIQAVIRLVYEKLGMSQDDIKKKEVIIKDHKITIK